MTDLEKMESFGFKKPESEKKMLVIKNWVKHEIPNDNLYSIEEKVDNINLGQGCYLHVAAKYAGSFILAEGATLVAPNLIKCNSIVLNAGAKAWCPNLEQTEEGWFAGSDINRNGTIFIGENALMYAPKVKPKHFHKEETGNFNTMPNPQQIASATSAVTPAAAQEENEPVAVLKKLKEMLDAGLIEQAEFDAKKAEILSRM